MNESSHQNNDFNNFGQSLLTHIHFKFIKTCINVCNYLLRLFRFPLFYEKLTLFIQILKIAKLYS